MNHEPIHKIHFILGQSRISINEILSRFDSISLIFFLFCVRKRRQILCYTLEFLICERREIEIVKINSIKDTCLIRSVLSLLGVLEVNAIINNGIAIEIFQRHFGMMQRSIVNSCIGVRSEHHKRYFLDCSMHNFLTRIFCKFVCIDRQAVDIPMLENLADIVSLRGIVQISVGSNAAPLLVSVENRIAKYVIRIVVLMLPDKRHLLTVHIVESASLDRATIRALSVIDRCPSGEIRLYVRHNLLLYWKIFGTERDAPVSF